MNGTFENIVDMLVLFIFALTVGPMQFGATLTATTEATD